MKFIFDWSKQHIQWYDQHGKRNSYYDYSQVENASADAASSKNETTKKYFQSLSMSIVMAELVLNGIMSIRLTEQKIMPHLAQLLSHTYLLQGNDLSNLDMAKNMCECLVKKI